MVGSTVTIDSAGAWSELNPCAVINTSFMLQYALYVILGGTFYFSEVGFPSSLKKTFCKFKNCFDKLVLSPTIVRYTKYNLPFQDIPFFLYLFL